MNRTGPGIPKKYAAPAQMGPVPAGARRRVGTHRARRDAVGPGIANIHDLPRRLALQFI
jgi:hypothetical protein